jgi:hypothetical protein
VIWGIAGVMAGCADFRGLNCGVSLEAIRGR